MPTLPNLSRKTIEARPLVGSVNKDVEAGAADALHDKDGTTSDGALSLKNNGEEDTLAQPYYLVFLPLGRMFLLLYSILFLFAWFGGHHEGSWLCEHYFTDITCVALGPCAAKEVYRQIMTVPFIEKAARRTFGLSQRRWSQAVAFTELVVMFAAWPFTYLRSRQDVRTCEVVP